LILHQPAFLKNQAGAKFRLGSALTKSSQRAELK